MLVVARRPGESLLIGNDIELTVKEINSNHINLCVNNSGNITIDKWKSNIIADGVKITVEKINKGQVKLGVCAPESMAINRDN
jgi:sRNA-binding carbon storage regulator CsrA